MAYIVIDYIVMAYIVITYIVMACIVMAYALTPVFVPLEIGGEKNKKKADAARVRQDRRGSGAGAVGVRPIPPRGGRVLRRPPRAVAGHG